MASRISLFSGFTLAVSLLAFSPSGATAQVVVSLTAEQVYDTNVFLESGDRISQLPDNLLLPDGSLPEDLDGDENDDFITSVGISFSGAEILGNTFDFAYDAGVGALFFADIEDEDRVTLDSFLELRARESLLARPLVASLSSNFDSGGASVAVAEGTAARQVQTHAAELTFGAQDYQIAQATNANLLYSLVRHDFLGEFLLSDRENNRRDAEGSDFFANSIDGSIAYQASPSTTFDFSSFVTLLTFTTAGSNEFEDLQEEELDRFDYGARVGVNRILSQKLAFRGSAGVDLSTFTDDLEPRAVERVNPDGTTTSTLEERDDTSISFAFSANLDYQAAQASLINVFVEQSSGVDTDGSRIIVRSAGLNTTHRLADSVFFAEAGRL